MAFAKTQYRRRPSNGFDFRQAEYRITDTPQALSGTRTRVAVGINQPIAIQVEVQRGPNAYAAFRSRRANVCENSKRLARRSIRWFRWTIAGHGATTPFRRAERHMVHVARATFKHGVNQIAIQMMEKDMQISEFFENITRGIGHTGDVARWTNGNWPLFHEGKPVPAGSSTWIDSMESILKGAEALRDVQLKTFRNVQQRTSLLAQSLGGSASPDAAVSALQSFAQDSLNEAMQYWTACREIAQNGEWLASQETAPSTTNVRNSHAASRKHARPRHKRPLPTPPAHNVGKRKSAARKPSGTSK